MIMGMIIGGVLALAQPWLMEQASGYRPRGWLLLSSIAWLLAGYGLGDIMRFSSYGYGDNAFLMIWKPAMFLLWFALPPLVQAFALGRDLRVAHGFMRWQGVVSAVLAYFLYQQALSTWILREYLCR